jgi:hypothetical protein
MCRLWIVVCLGLLGACGDSFKNVKATAKLGKAVGDDPIVVNDWIADCEAIHATANDAALETICLSKQADYKGMVQTVSDVSDLLTDYATNLADAADADDVTVGDDLTAVLKQAGTLNVDSVKRHMPVIYNIADVLNKDSTLTDKLTPSGVATIIDTVVKFASQSYRRESIQDAVEAADPHIQVLCAFLSAEIELHVKDLTDLRKLLDDEVPARPLVETTPVVAQILPLVAATLDERIASLQRADAAAKAFGDAHHKLADAMKAGRPWKNAELLLEIKKDVETIVKTVHG